MAPARVHLGAQLDLDSGRKVPPAELLTVNRHNSFPGLQPSLTLSMHAHLAVFSGRPPSGPVPRRGTIYSASVPPGAYSITMPRYSWIRNTCGAHQQPMHSAHNTTLNQASSEPRVEQGHDAVRLRLGCATGSLQSHAHLSQ